MKLKNIMNEQLIQELEFPDNNEFKKYARKHNIRGTTKITVDGKETTAGELKAELNFKKKPTKRKAPSENPFIRKYGKLKLNAFPPIGVDEKSVKVNTSGNIHTHAVLQWKDPKSGRTVSSYTQKFMQKNANIKWKRVQRLKDEYVDSIAKKSTDLLNRKNKTVQDAGAIISIIAETGLRPGSIAGFNDTTNRGVSTLSPENVTIKGDTVILNFVGKSYQPNNAEFKSKELAKFLKTRIQERKGQEFLFGVTNHQLNTVFDKVGRKGIKLKDLRTYTATKMAKNILETDKTPPPPLPKSQTEIKKAIKAKLKNVFEVVSQKLNNTPAMVKSSYVHPKVIEEWLAKLGVEPTLIK